MMLPFWNRREASDLAKAAIVSLKERNGSSLQAIKKFVMAKKKTGYVNGTLLRVLKAAVESRPIVRVGSSLWNARESRRGSQYNNSSQDRDHMSSYAIVIGERDLEEPEETTKETSKRNTF